MYYVLLLYYIMYYFKHFTIFSINYLLLFYTKKLRIIY